MKIKTLLGIILTILTLIGATSPALSDTLLASDFKLESWAKTIDFYDYARAYALLHGMTRPPDNWHANLYMTYINTKGLQLLYAGLSNITFNEQTYFTIPMQTFMMHYKTNNNTRDVLMASTFLMLLAFNETSNSIYTNSPDVNDTLWASFSMGFDLSALNATLPSLNSKTETIPLTHSTDKLQWSWGMKYTNLTALWWQTWIDPNNPHFDNSWPIAITVYDELTFTYNLTINPDTNTATLTENHIIGQMNNLLLRWLPLSWIHYNNTGTYFLGAKIANDTIHDFIQNNQIKMSIVNFQTSILLDRETYSQSANGQNVTDTDNMISNSSITTYADDGEKLYDVTFGTKQTYKLYNNLTDPTQYETYNATTRTSKINGFAGNTGLFTYHIGLMKFLPLLIVNMHPQLYQKAKETITNMSRANYFYLISYPNYSGYKIEHDPTFTIYLDTSVATNPPNWGGILIIGAIIAIAIVTATTLLRRRKPKQTQTN
jgi:hypothetical protein